MQKIQTQVKLEKAALKEQFDFIYNKYLEKKEQSKQLIKQVDRYKKHMENQRKIYERLFTEGYAIDEVRKIMERYMQKQRENSPGLESSKAKT